MKENNDKREIKQRRIDSSLNYPTYGRGIDPTPDIDTYMINNNLCLDGSSHVNKSLRGESKEK